MKKFALLLIASAFSLSTYAQTADKVESVTVKANTSASYKMWPADFYQFKGSYELANGQVLSLTSQGRQMFAQIEGQDRHEIVATGRNSFVALDRQLKMRIDWQANGTVSGEVYVGGAANAKADQVQWTLYALR
ncbi:MAG: hypothetical protein HYZ45_03430 [Burkholderiales bacterium]|nr:hypothetical protein [Burkholderiales bacterium]